MKKICAWCNKNLNDIKENDEKSISHGICPVCLKKHFQIDNVENMKKLLDKFNNPIMVVDSDGNILSANDVACEMLGKIPEEIEGYKGGVVMECENSVLPGGCGKTKKCEGCRIQNSVMKTLATGKPVNKEKVKLYKLNSFENEPVEMNISTQKINDVVLLRIDEIE